MQTIIENEKSIWMLIQPNGSYKINQKPGYYSDVSAFTFELFQLQNMGHSIWELRQKQGWKVGHFKAVFNADGNITNIRPVA